MFALEAGGVVYIKIDPLRREPSSRRRVREPFAYGPERRR